jgi:hypothetical protein
LSASGPSTFHIFHLENKKMGNGGFSRTEEGMFAEDLENLLISIVWIEIFHQKCDHNVQCLEDKGNLWLSSILDYF